MNDGLTEAAPEPPRLERRWRLAVALLALAAMLALPAAAIGWLASTAPGTAWLLARLPGVSVTSPEGSLIGDFAAARVVATLPGGEDKVLIDRLSWQGLALSRARSGPAWLRVELRSLQAQRLELRLAATETRPPQSLAVPVELAIGSIAIAELVAPEFGAHPVEGLRAGLELGAEGGSLHRIDDLALSWDRIDASGSLRIATQAPFDLQASVAVTSRPGAEASRAFAASLALSGPLERPALRGALRGTGGAAPELDIEATLAPFAPWPLAALALRTEALDLAALASAAPATAIAGSAELASTAGDLPATVHVALANARAGRYDAGLLPVRRLDAELRARPDDPARGEIVRLALALGSEREAGGRLEGSGHWAPGELGLDFTLDGLAPRALDSRAAPLRVSGRASLAGSTAAGGDWSATLRGRFSGGLPADGRLRSLVLDLDADASATHVELRRARLQAGPTNVSLQGRAQRTRPDAADWRIDAQGALDAFDPAQWWPGREGSAWHKGPHRIDASLALRGLLASAGSGDLLDRIGRLSGEARLVLAATSQLGGQALAGSVALQGGGAAAEVDARLSVGGSSLALRGKVVPGGADHWELAGHDAELAPWAALAALGAGQAPALAGRLDAEVAVDGRWPRIATRGQAALRDARVGISGRLGRAELSWKASTASRDAPLEIRGEADQAELGAQKLDRMSLVVDGSLAAHSIALDGASPAQSPRWLDLLHGAGASAGTQALLRAKGGLGLDPEGLAPLRWQGELQQAQILRRSDAKGERAWFEAGATAVELSFDPPTGAMLAALGPGRATLPNLALRWSELRWQRQAGASRLDLEAGLLPFAPAPLLARLQPDFGWGGDLVVTGKLSMHSAPTMAAEIVIERERGDLSVTDVSGTQALELTDLRLGLIARDGTWNFTQALAGRSLGALGSALTVRTDPRALWPPADAPLQGVMELQIANLAAWGAWAPPGWRLQGRIHAGLAFGGRFGAPEYEGSIEGSGLALRSLVEGVDLSDGELAVDLEGATARIRKLEIRGGDGSARVEGEAKFGATPRLDLRLVAEKLRLLNRVDRRVVASGEATLAMQRDALRLAGRFVVDEGLIDISRGTAPRLGDDVTVLREARDEPAADAPRGSRAREVDLKVEVDLGRALRLRGRGLDTRLGGELVFTTPGGRLALNGTVRAIDGSYRAYNQKLAIERGSLLFTGALDNPRLDILAVRPNVDVRVGVEITGSVQQPRVALFSEPDMSDNAKLSWLVLGRPPEETGGGDTALLQAAAVALLAGEGGDGTLSQLMSLNPLDTLSVRQTDGAVRDTVLTVGKQLSQRWYIGYERVLSQTSGNWQLIYRLGQRITVRLQAGVDNAIDVIWSWRWP